MTPTKDNIKYSTIAPSDGNVDKVFKSKILKPFDNIAIDFISELSNKILKNNNLKEFPELVSMAFWMRKSHILSLKKEFFNKKKERVWLARGTAFHIAPSNVDTIFIYSWFLSLLVGNKNIIRVSQNNNEQLDILLELINKQSSENKFKQIQDKFLIMTYEHNNQITEFFSKNCDIRVIWGGDNTINQIRSIPIKPTAIELSFADKFSIAIINSKEILNKLDNDELFKNFYNDSFWFDQQACSSPKLVCWVGNDSDMIKAKKIFWNGVSKVYDEKFDEFSSTRAVDKMVATYSLAIEKDNIFIDKNPLIQTVQLDNHNSIARDLHCGAGLFYELKLKNLDELNEFIIKKDQTIGVYGFDKETVVNFVSDNLPQGIDRIVSIGRMMDFSYVWDGHDLLREFCREINIDI